MASVSPAGWPLPQRTSDRSSSVVLNQCLSAPLWRRLGVSSRETASIHQAGKTVNAQKKNKHYIWLYSDIFQNILSENKSKRSVWITTGSDITCMQEFQVVENHLQHLAMFSEGLQEGGTRLMRYVSTNRAIVCDGVRDVPLQLVHPLIRGQETPLSSFIQSKPSPLAYTRRSLSKQIWRISTAS